MRRLVPLLLLSAMLAGCAAPDEAPPPATDQVRLYRATYEGADVWPFGSPHGWLSVLTNYGTQPTLVEVVRPKLADDGVPIGTNVVYREAPGRGETERPDALGNGANGSISMVLQPGERVLIGTSMDGALYQSDHNVTWGFRTYTSDQQPIRTALQTWTLTVTAASTSLAPGDQVRTTTVGFFLNGESFFTNSADVLADPNFPYDATLVTQNDLTDPLLIYVYQEDANEQPYGSADRCYTTRNDGYNDMLLNQSLGSTSIALVQPEEAYTRPETYDHRLYGETLVYMTTVVQHDGAVSPEDNAPDPSGACFDPLRPCGDIEQETATQCPDESIVDRP